MPLQSWKSQNAARAACFLGALQGVLTINRSDVWVWICIQICLGLRCIRISFPLCLSALPFPAHPSKGDCFLLRPPSAFVAASPLFPITASVNNPHLNEGTCIESPLWSGAAELCRSSQRCCSQWASRKIPSPPT